MTPDAGAVAGPIPPAPTPMSFSIFTMPAGQDLVVLEVHHAAGTFIAFLDPTSARSMAGQLDAAAGQAKSGLTIASGPMPQPRVKGRG